jgi:hypothetical protein
MSDYEFLSEPEEKKQVTEEYKQETDKKKKQGVAPLDPLNSLSEPL